MSASQQPGAFRVPMSGTKRGAQTIGFTGSQSDRARLIVIAGTNRGAKHPVKAGLTVGRGRSVQLLLDGDDISREHVRFHGGLAWEVEDLGSRNGTFVNDMPVQGRTMLRFGDRIRLGSHTVILFTRFDPAEEELLKRQRLELLGRMAAGIVHDVNNLLGALLATQDYLLETPHHVSLGDPETRECMQEIKAAGEQAAHLMPKLLSFARGHTDGHARFCMSTMCEEVIQIVRRTFDRRIRVSAEIAPDQHMLGDRIELQQVLMNLCVNARDAMSDGGELSIALARRDADTLAVTVTDTGDGMSSEICERIFEPFFTTKLDGRGSGLGLATAKEMIVIHGGDISVASRLGEGTCFTLMLPAAKGAAEVNTLIPVWEVQAAPGRILLVDDDDLCRKAYARLLTRAGHTVEVAPGGHDALRMLQGGPIPDLVLLDVDMPGLSGEETLRMMRLLVPTLNVVVATGNRDTDRHAAMMRAGASELLCKPFSADTLASAVSAALECTALDEPTSGDPFGPAPTRR